MGSSTSGPFTRSWTSAGPLTPLGYVPKWQWGQRTWYRQTKPYDRPLEFHSNIRTVLSCVRHYPSWNGYVEAYCTGTDAQPGLLADAKNKALADLVEKAGDPALWSTNLAERKQAMGMIVSDVGTLIKFCRKLNRFDFLGAGKVLGVVRHKKDLPRGLKEGAKSFGNNFLKFHFGWEPLVKDIGASVDLLQQPYPSGRLVGKGTVRKLNLVTNSDVNGKPIVWLDYRTSCRLQVDVRVISPNLFLANQVGFVNPLSVAWELVPFSFVADWFANVGQFLNQHSDLAGLELNQPWTTTFQRGTGTSNWILSGIGPVYTAQYAVYHTDRVAGLPTVSLRVRPWKGVSAVRAATAVSLLTQFLR